MKNFSRSWWFFFIYSVLATCFFGVMIVMDIAAEREQTWRTIMYVIMWVFFWYGFVSRILFNSIKELINGREEGRID